MAHASPLVTTPREIPVYTNSRFPAITQALTFIRSRRWVVLLVSAIALIPCFWHRHIQATDLGSHLYAAWLANLIQQGAAPGLYIVPQHTNVLFDLMLAPLLTAFGTIAAERIAVSVCALLFFWGAFALCSAAAGQAAWYITPLLLMTCYGFVFNMGFFNAYLSIALSLFGLAILWRGHRWDFLTLLPLLVPMYLAHLFGTAAFFVLGALLLMFRFLPARWHPVPIAAVIASYFLARWYVLHHFYVFPPDTHLYWMSGADQFVIYAHEYAWVALGVLALAAIFFR